jgi:hypothetical protein
VDAVCAPQPGRGRRSISAPHLGNVDRAARDLQLQRSNRDGSGARDLRAEPGNGTARTQAAIARSRPIRRHARTPRRQPEGRSVELAGTEDLARIERAIERLGWTRDRFDAWLCSPSSPLGTHGKPQIRTVAHANKVWWAMKRLLQERREVGGMMECDGTLFTLLQECAKASVNDGRCEVHQ